jgi:hypothetical protein
MFSVKCKIKGNLVLNNKTLFDRVYYMSRWARYGRFIKYRMKKGIVGNKESICLVQIRTYLQHSPQIKAHDGILMVATSETSILAME